MLEDWNAKNIRHTKNLTNLKEDTQHFDKTGGF